MNPRASQTSRKLRGGYYTPAALAAFLVRWLKPIRPRRILEPACGDGAFLEPVAAHLGQPHLLAFEIDEREAHLAAARMRGLDLRGSRVCAADFLAWAADRLPWPDAQFDAVLGNPPYIRYQYLTPRFQADARHIHHQLGCRFTRHANAWNAFVLGALALLRPGGRLAMVVPSEIIHVAHAQGLRAYLMRTCDRILLIDPEALWFEGTQQGTVLLLAEKKMQAAAAGAGLAIHAVRGFEFAEMDPERIFEAGRYANGPELEGKWTHALLGASTRALMQELEAGPAVRRFHETAEVAVGITTGANDYFLVDDATVDKFRLGPWAHPMFGRSRHSPGVIYDEHSHAANAARGRPTNFLWFRGTDAERRGPARSYLDRGERQRLHTRYKCRMRRPWYAVPSVYATEVGMPRRIHDAPRLIRNTLGAYTTDTTCRVRVRAGTADRMVHAFINALTALSAELEGRHYGGGVLELVPSEIARLLVPASTGPDPDLRGLDALVCTQPMATVLERQTAAVLAPLGISASRQAELLDAWQRLRARRQRTCAPGK